MELENLSQNQFWQLMGWMSADDIDDLPDGAWQAQLEASAKAWAEDAGIEIDSYEAFMAYVAQDGI